MELKAFVEKCKDEGHFIEIFNSGNHDRLCWNGGAKEEDLAISLSHHYDRMAADDQFEASIEKTWTDLKEKNPFLFNGSKFRLHGVRNEAGDSVSLLLGQTCYRDYVCTNMNDKHWRFLRDYGKREYANEHACFSDALGVGSVVETSDIKKTNKQTVNKNVVDIEDMDGKAVVYELFHSIVREVRDEVNIPEEYISWPLLTGIYRNHHTGQKPGACFRIRCSLKGEEIHEFYRKGGPEAYESSQLLLVDLAEFQRGMSSSKVKELFKDFTPGCKACLYFYFNLQTNFTV
ncbi:hypothetical protein pdam_00013801 [Pocillopora damicornis]|uniref:Nudix hydrolase domain-containing protein n=1 Tax=Pocillopora damicornis TaxID=46731 RepID=A0A3M6T7S6_POCDA|nr:hypothetical protein pdam_00013801 [Pocillopora damicornis]